MIDVKHQINEVRREVGNRVLEAGEVRVITISQAYPGSLEDVWDACTNPERLPRWFLPISGDLRVGGRFQLEGNAGGTIERCDPPRSFAATWEYEGAVSWIEVRLSAEPDGHTRLELDHLDPVGGAGDEMWAQFGPGAGGVGWDLGLLGLAQHLTSDEPVDPEAAAAWLASDDGREFITLSSQRWAEASIAAGTPEPAARAAEQRTTATYTGAEQPPGS